MANISLELKPFSTPNFVIVKTPPRPRQEGIIEAPSIPLHELSAQTLDELCNDFRDEVFFKAEKKDPRKGINPKSP